MPVHQRKDQIEPVRPLLSQSANMAARQCDGIILNIDNLVDGPTVHHEELAVEAPDDNAKNPNIPSESATEEVCQENPNIQEWKHMSCSQELCQLLIGCSFSCSQ